MNRRRGPVRSALACRARAWRGFGPRARLVALALGTVVAGGCGGSDGAAIREATLALDFTPNAAHAGVYAALRSQLDRRRGVALRVIAPTATADSLKLLLAGRADLAIVDLHDLGLARERGSDVVGVGAIVQRPLAAVIARPGLRRPRELENRRVGLAGLPSDEAVLRAVVLHDGGDPARVRRTTVGFGAVLSLVAGRVDAVVAFWSAEGVALRRRGVRTREFRVGDYGAPPYPELVLVTTRRTLRERPRLVDAVVGTLAAGTDAALRDRAAAVAAVARVSGADERLVAAQLDVVAPALTPPLRLDRGALERWA
ncbi:MAG: ABC transporter substrate-binding protein, partial [Nocardioidaceae bacterium]